MPDDPLETNPTPTPVISSSGQKRFTCVGCGCVMTANGQDIWSLGEGYKEWKKLEDRLAKKDEEIGKLNEEIRALKAERDALKGSNAPARQVGHLIHK